MDGTFTGLTFGWARAERVARNSAVDDAKLRCSQTLRGRENSRQPFERISDNIAAEKSETRDFCWQPTGRQPLGQRGFDRLFEYKLLETVPSHRHIATGLPKAELHRERTTLPATLPRPFYRHQSFFPYFHWGTAKWLKGKWLVVAMLTLFSNVNDLCGAWAVPPLGRWCISPARLPGTQYKGFGVPSKMTNGIVCIVQSQFLKKVRMEAALLQWKRLSPSLLLPSFRFILFYLFICFYPSPYPHRASDLRKLSLLTRL